MASSSSTTALYLCSSFSTKCKITQNPHFISKTHFFSNPKIGSFSKSHKLSITRPSFLPILKASETEASVLDSPSDAPELETAPFVEVSAEETPKREEVFAVVMIGGRQYIVIPGRFLYVQRLKGADVNDKVTLNKVLLVGTRDSTYIGKPLVTNAVVNAVVEEQGKNKKVIVFKYKKKKNYRRNIGHRQPNTRIRITSITGYQEYPAVTLAE